MRRTVGWLVAALVLVGACASGPAWIFPTPAPLPEGAEAVAIRVQPIPTSIAADASFGCPAALLSPTEMVVDRSVSPPTVSFRSAETGEPIELEWSWGISAYELDGVVHIVAPDGQDLMVEGRVADDLGGGFGADDAVFGVCDFRSFPQRAGAYGPRRDLRLTPTSTRTIHSAAAGPTNRSSASSLITE